MLMLYVWLAIFCISIFVELSVPALVSIWFAGGSLLSLIISVFAPDTPVWIILEVVVFIGASIGCVFAIRPIIRKKQQLIKTNVDSLIGQLGIVKDNITEFENGTVKINGLVWTAVLFDKSSPIYESDVVEIVEVKGNKLIVKKKENN